LPVSDRVAVLVAPHAQLPVIWRLLPEGLTLTVTDHSVRIRPPGAEGPRHVPEPLLCLTSLSEEIHMVAMDVPFNT
jgi:hypothetical protein